MAAASGASIALLGEFDVRIHGQHLSVPVTVQRVLGFLALAGTRPTRETVAGHLWPFTSQARAQANLRTALWQLKRAHGDVVRLSRDRIWLAEEVDVDYHAMTEVARRLLIGALCEPDLLRTPFDQFTRDLLPGWDEDWLLIERERHRQLRMHVLEAMSHHLIDLRRYALAAEAAYAAIAIEPLCESAHRTLTRVFLAEGNPTEAVRQFDLYRSLLHDETGFGPTGEFVALFDGVPVPRAASPRLTAQHGPPPSDVPYGLRQPVHQAARH